MVLCHSTSCVPPVDHLPLRTRAPERISTSAPRARRFPLATGPGPELTALYRATTLSAPWEPGRLRGRGRGGRATVRQYARPRYASTAYTSTGAATPFKGTAPRSEERRVGKGGRARWARAT